MSNPAARFLRRTAIRQIAAYQASHTDIKVFSLENNFTAKAVTDIAFVWDRWVKNPRAQMKIEQNGTLTLSLHSNCWYVLSEPGN